MGEAESLDLKAARNNVAHLFQLIEIERVICVDDYYEFSQEDVVQLCIELSQLPELAVLLQVQATQGIPFDELPDDWAGQLRSKLNDLSDNELFDLYDELCNLHPKKWESSPNKVATLLQEQNFERLSPREWDENQERLLNESETRTTLFLFDQHLGTGQDEAGIQRIKEIYTKPNGEKRVFGLLSSTFDPDEEYLTWIHLSEKYEINKDQFLPISKKHNSFESSADMIKLIVLNRFCSNLKHQIMQLFTSAQAKAQKQIDQIDIFDFGHMIFRTSWEEGIWEPDTLIRIFAIHQRQEILNLAHTTPKIKELADTIRQTIDMKPKFITAKSNYARTVMQLERFEQGDYLTTHNIPLELGDIFETMHGSTKKRFILLAQPCELMVRNTGKRDIENGLLFQIQQKSPPAPELQNYPLSYFEEASPLEYYVNFKRRISVNLMILDLCVFHDTGTTSLNIGASTPTGLIASWQKRFEFVYKYFEKAVIKLEKHIEASDLAEEEYAYFLPCASTDPRASADYRIKTKYTSSPQSIEYGLKRIRRLLQPASGELLLRYANFNARMAFDHELDSEVEDT